ncbi:GntR family transcriptional regulator [Evansella tamaricis]|uniref:GntR family transcriptional regulator n=1 Tax=Evansella tamaricis TaxID=2069301 RepID=A0ABS6JDX7_9BACI|nr:GntR family transcriptional regulator [Evansella tamaricis]MBU9711874.1 GntR family transcriptional regulator [Evansella tamaricis]
MINKRSPIPIYYQLEELIKDMIEKGTLKKGDMIPPEREYAEKYEISRMTVRQALNNLVNDGYLSRVKGKGTFVENRKIEQPLMGLTSFTEDMVSRGLEPRTKLLHLLKKEASASESEKLKIKQGAPVYEVKRIRLADDEPMALETMFLSAELVGELKEEVVNGSLYQYFEESLGYSIVNARQGLEASIVRKSEREYLNVPSGSPVLLIERTSYLADGKPLEFVKSIYRADRYKFLIDMNREGN